MNAAHRWGEPFHFLTKRVRRLPEEFKIASPRLTGGLLAPLLCASETHFRECDECLFTYEIERDNYVPGNSESGKSLEKSSSAPMRMLRVVSPIRAEELMHDNAANTGKDTIPATQAATGGSNQRRERRLPCVQSTVVLEVSGHPERVEGRVVEVSKSGLQLVLGTSVLAGDLVRITCTRMIISGHIRYCRSNDAGSFNTGVEIDDAQYID